MVVLFLAVTCLALVALVAVLLTRGPGESRAVARIDAVDRSLARVEQALREEVRSASRDTAQSVHRASESLVRAQAALGDAQARQLQACAAQLAAFAQSSGEQLSALRHELLMLQEQRWGAVRTDLDALRSGLARSVETLRAGVERCLRDIQQDTAAKLDSMRQIVDEKLESTLERRLGESFRQVSERLEQVYRGLGEMQVLATGVGDLKRVLSNVKARGTWGEVQLATLLEQVLARDQYEQNVAMDPSSGERVEFAIRLPGKSGGGDAPTWLPIDAKFPLEDYQSLLEASERADTLAMDDAGRRLEARIKACAKEISTKYINPPGTTDFALMFLPNEGLYAEVLRRPGLVDVLQREHRVVVTGPMTLWAVLNSLQMGFRTLAIQHRSSEVWALLGAVKTEFGKFGTVLDAIQKNLHRAATKIDEARKGTRAIERKLTGVQELPVAEAALLLDGALLEAPEHEETAVS